MITPDVLAEILRLAREGHPGAVEWIAPLVAEVEQLRAKRPSCETCKWGQPTDCYDAYCHRINGDVDPDQTNGYCLWEAK